MSTVAEHYEQHLARVYDWMAGGAEAATERSRRLLAGLNLPPARDGGGALAVDLGCGSGFQTIPLAEAGYEVLAVDSSAALLEELTTRAGSFPIRVVRDDLRNFPAHLAGRAPGVIVCMGDTLTHLPTLAEVAGTIRDAAEALAPDGVLVLAFRDLFTHELRGPARFIPVRSDAGRVFTCFLEYGTDFVTVHDLLHERDPAAGEDDGVPWSFRASAYRKLRLDPAWVRERITDAGLRLTKDAVEGGFVVLVGRKDGEGHPAGAPGSG